MSISHPTTSRAGDHDRRIGANIRSARIAAGMSQQDFAEKIGVTYQQAHKYERGLNRVSATRLTLIARVLNRPAAWFLDDAVAEETTAPRATLGLVRDYQSLPEAMRAIVRDLARSLAATHAG